MKKNLKAGALLYTLVISFVIFLLCGLLILSAYLSRLEIINLNLFQKLVENAQSGINLARSNPALFQLENEAVIDLFGKGEDSVRLEKKQWGIFNILACTSFSGTKEQQLACLLGQYTARMDTLAIYLVDKNTALTLAGNTYLNGICYLPKSGTKRGTFEQIPYTGNQLVHGDIRISTNQLPIFDSIIEKKLFEQLYSLHQDSIIEFESIEQKNKIINSFFNKRLVIHSKNKIKLHGKQIIGNVFIQSDQEIEIDADNEIVDAIFFSPSIKLNSKLMVQGQFFSSDSILIEKDVILNYPSVIGIFASQPENLIRKIVLKEDSKVYGEVVTLEPELIGSSNCQIVLDSSSSVICRVYSNGTINIRGQVIGSVYTKEFYIQSGNSYYSNLLFNASIDRPSLNSKFVLSGILEKSSNLQVIKWIKN